MKTYTLYWLDGKREIVNGYDPADAMNRAGYGAGALRALDFYSSDDCKDYVWNSEKRTWDLTDEAWERKFGGKRRLLVD